MEGDLEVAVSLNWMLGNLVVLDFPDKFGFQKQVVYSYDHPCSPEEECYSCWCYFQEDSPFDDWDQNLLDILGEGVYTVELKIEAH